MSKNFDIIGAGDGIPQNIHEGRQIFYFVIKEKICNLNTEGKKSNKSVQLYYVNKITPLIHWRTCNSHEKWLPYTLKLTSPSWNYWQYGIIYIWQDVNEFLWIIWHHCFWLGPVELVSRSCPLDIIFSGNNLYIPLW